MSKTVQHQQAKTVDSLSRQKGFRFFATIGRLSVRFRWLVLLIWLVGVFVSVHFLPSLSSVTQSDNSAFLPASSPTEKAAKLASVFGSKSNATPVQVVLTDASGPLTNSDEAAITGLQAKLAKVSGVEKVQDAGHSADGQADELIVLISGSSNFEPTPIITSLRTSISTSTLPNGLQAHLAGQIATAVDNSKKSGSDNAQLGLGSVLFIIVLLLLIFRAPLAPLITLIPPILVVFASGPLIAEAGHHGLKVSSLAQLLLTVLVLGAGTDYGLFLIFRVREELQGGLSSREAIVKALSRVGESITFSAATVIAALLSLTLATFEIYSDLGAPLAIGIGLMLLAGLTLLPALLAIFGRAVFWPSKRYKRPGTFGLWGKICASVVQHPAPIMVGGLIFFGGLALALPGYKAGGFAGTITSPSGSDSAAGNTALARHFPSSSANPTAILFVMPHSVWADPTPLTAIGQKLTHAPEFKGVSGPLNPNGVVISPEQLKQFYTQFGPTSGNRTNVLRGKGAEVSTVDPAFRAYLTLGNYISKDGHTVEFAVGLTAGEPGSTAAMNAVPAIRTRVSSIAQQIGATNSGIAGETTGLYDINSISNSDLKRVVPVAILVIGILLGILMRSLVAPVYLILSVALSYLAALGLSIIIFIDIAGGDGLEFILPFLMFIFLLALGEDYNILVMTRIREEAHGLPLRKAVSQALSTTGTTVTSAGLVLAGTFTVLAVVGGRDSSQVRDIGVGLALGILMDTFLVRTLLVPSVVALLGHWNWWPTKHGSWVEAED
ncbi:MAG TPA: MMPL family transporter [Candidatus Saccharimonadales bacterium]|nr:MMPL family transporter [Candidatus Saccharimonadales bacterium]